RFARYLRDQFDGSPAAPGYPRDVVFAVFDGGNPVPPGDPSWPLTASDSPAFRKPVPVEQAAVRPGQHFVFLGPVRPGWAPQGYFHDAPPATPDAWWSANPSPGGPPTGYWSQLLYQGRGRYQKLVLAGLARDVQSLPVCTPADLAA